jgi:hypothetical protein
VPLTLENIQHGVPIERKVYSTLKKYKDSIINNPRSSLMPHHKKLAHLYSLPKIYKNRISLQPLINSRNSPCQPVVKHLLKIVSP